MARVFESGLSIGPPAERLYAVEPVGVETRTPSPKKLSMYSSLT